MNTKILEMYSLERKGVVDFTIRNAIRMVRNAIRIIIRIIIIPGNVLAQASHLALLRGRP